VQYKNKTSSDEIADAPESIMESSLRVIHRALLAGFRWFGGL